MIARTARPVRPFEHDNELDDNEKGADRTRRV